MKTNPHDLTGQRIGRLTVLYRSTSQNQGRTYRWMCQCDCGTHVQVRRQNLIAQTTKSCGCLRRDMASGRNLKPGEVRFPPRKGSDNIRNNASTYKSWMSMRTRCNSPNSDDFPRYGGRGIRVCERWDSFDLFLEDMGPRPAGCTLDRINNAGHYEPTNCRWATHKQQARNRSNNTLVELNGEVKSLSEWCDVFGIRPRTVYGRMHDGMSPAEAISKPLPNRYRFGQQQER